MTTSQPSGPVQRLIREIVIPLAGLGGIYNEAIVRSGDPRIYLLVVFVSMIGLPPFINSEHVAAVVDVLRRRNGNGHTNADDKPPVSTFSVTRLARRFT